MIVSQVRISIHALLAESDIRNAEAVSKYMIFLSTLSLRRATVMPVESFSGNRHFYPRSPCGERLIDNVHALQYDIISIHALLAESDLTQADLANRAELFLSTLSLRRATIDTSKDVIKTANFYPRSPCGERPT